MNYIENLLQGQKVEWKTLGELVETITAPLKVKKEKYQAIGKIPIIDQGEKFIAGYIDEGEFLEESEYIIFGDHSEHIKYVDFAFVQGADGLKILKAKKDFSKYLYYAFQNFYRKEGNYKRHWSSAKDTEIPIPPLSVQKEIANILDKFTTLKAELEAELEAELDCRKRQYHHYRDTLLTFEDKVEWKTLGEITIYTQNIKWKENSDTYCYIDLTSVNLESTIIATKEINYETAPSRAQKIVERDDVIFATTRPTQMRIALINNDYHGQIASTGYCVLRANQNQVLPKWIYFCLTTMDFKNYLEENQSGSAYPAISDGKLKEYKIPIPPIEEQRRIVNILDKFDTLTNSITEGLPKEIELRRKQYEYYREQLLAFNQ